MQQERFGNSLILMEKLASGGMGEVFKAKQLGTEGFEKIVAVKRVLPHLSTRQDFSQLFKHEMWLASKLQHSNIAQVFSNGTHDQYLYLVMEYVQGRTLAEIIASSVSRNDPLSVKHCCYIISEAAKGLHYAHTRRDDESGAPLNIIHRDVTPQNIMCSEHGEVKVLDFGIAKVVDHISDLSRIGDIRGKLQYVSPEQLEGKPVSAQSDVFALGVVLFEMLVGQPLFLDESPYLTIDHIINKEVPSLSEFRTNVPKELNDILQKALAKKPAERYATAEALHRALSQFLSVNYPSYSPTELGRMVQSDYIPPSDGSTKPMLNRYEQALAANLTQDFRAPGAYARLAITKHLTRVTISVLIGLLIALAYHNLPSIVRFAKLKRRPSTTPLATFVADEIPVSEDGRVATWSGRAGDSSVHFTQNIPQHRPSLVPNGIGKHSTVKFEGNQYLTSLDLARQFVRAGQASFIFVVKLKRETLGYIATLQQADKQSDVVRVGTDDSNHIRLKTTANPSTSIFLTSKTKYSDQFQIVTVTMDYQFNKVFINGQLSVVAELPEDIYFEASYSMNIGMDYDFGIPTEFLVGEIAEMLFFDAALTDYHRELVEKNLSTKYGIALTEAGR